MSDDEYTDDQMTTPGGSRTDPLALFDDSAGREAASTASKRPTQPRGRSRSSAGGGRGHVVDVREKGGGRTRLQYGAPPPTDIELLLRKQAAQMDRMMQMVTNTQQQAADNARHIAEAASGGVLHAPAPAELPPPPWVTRFGFAGRWCAFDQYKATGRTVDQSLVLDTDRATGRTFVQEPAAAPPAGRSVRSCCAGSGLCSVAENCAIPRDVRAGSGGGPAVGGGTTATAAAVDFSNKLNEVPRSLRLSMTYDQSKEMVKHAEITQKTGIAVYFADPYSPCQRGSNENTNGLLRQYLPKGTDLSAYSQEELDKIADSLNTRPRKTLDWRTPLEVYAEVLKKSITVPSTLQ